MKPTTGYVFKDKQKGKWCARVSFTDTEAGKRRSVRRFFSLKAEAVEALPGLLSTLQTHGARPLQGEQMTMADLIDLYVQEHVRPPEIRNGRKIAGLKSHQTVHTHCVTLKAFFRAKSLRDIRPSDLERFKRHRLKVPKEKGGGERTITAVNRELEVLRAVFNYAKREGWLIFSPFEKAKAIIKKSAETKRFRVLSPDDEARLLAACTDKREHLRAILIFCLDTGARRGEAFDAQWRDVDLPGRKITLRASKTESVRDVPVTARLGLELEKLWLFSKQDHNAKVFGGITDVKKSFAAACKAAGIEDFRLHDCRHSFVSRLVRQGISLVEVMRLSGHSTLSAFNVYANQLSDATEKSADALNNFHSENTGAIAYIN